MSTTWLSWATKHDLSSKVTSGRFGDGHGDLLGVCLHVNDADHGTPDSFWYYNPDNVVPNVQIYGPHDPVDGAVHQMLPLEQRPWCQVNGNAQYAAIEMAGRPGYAMSPAQLAAAAHVMAAYHVVLGVPLQVCDTPGQRGLITHQDGGVPWGGHPCPGPIRSGQRAAIIRAAKAIVAKSPDAAPSPSPKHAVTSLDDELLQHINGMIGGAIAAYAKQDLANDLQQTKMLQQITTHMGLPIPD